MVYYDSRWCNSGGIGRFCKEISSSKSLIDSFFIRGDLVKALSIKDVFSLSKITLSDHYFISPGYNCPLFSAGRAIVTIHDLMHLNFPEYSSIKNKVYYEYVVKRTVKSAPLVFTVSEFTRQEIATWASISIDKIAVVSNGVDHEFYHLAVNPIVRKRPYFFYVGNNKSHKNLKRLVQAFALSGLSCEMDLLLSCGATIELSDLVMALGLSDSVVFLDGIDEAQLPSYYKGAVATVVVSLYEGFCLPILESMAVGTPVVTSNITAMPETAGNAAIFVDPYDVDSIKTSLIDVVENLLKRNFLIEAGLFRVKLYSWDNSRKLWDQALSPILDVK